MELIPVLSTIILVATISTFLLAIGAYVLYKMRERKGQDTVITQPAEVKAELVTPAEEKQPAKKIRTKVVLPSTYAEPQRTPGYKQPAGFTQKETIKKPRPMQPRFTPKPQPFGNYRQPYSTTFEQPARQLDTAGYTPVFHEQRFRTRSDEDKRIKDSKFLKYTSEGYVPAKEDKDAGALKWR